MINALLCRGTDVGYRYGVEGFCFNLRKTDEKLALASAQKIWQSVGQQHTLNSESVIDLTVSCGVITYQQEQDVTPEIIFDRANKALYKAK